eukprot:899096-Prorocentrum_minimum.AAC.1
MTTTLVLSCLLPPSNLFEPLDKVPPVVGRGPATATTGCHLASAVLSQDAPVRWRLYSESLRCEAESERTFASSVFDVYTYRPTQGGAGGAGGLLLL